MSRPLIAISERRTLDGLSYQACERDGAIAYSGVMNGTCMTKALDLFIALADGRKFSKMRVSQMDGKTRFYLEVCP